MEYVVCNCLSKQTILVFPDLEALVEVRLGIGNQTYLV